MKKNPCRFCATQVEGKCYFNPPPNPDVSDNNVGCTNFHLDVYTQAEYDAWQLAERQNREAREAKERAEAEVKAQHGKKAVSKKKGK